MFVPRTVQRQQQRDDFAIGKARLRPARRFSAADQMRCPWRFQGLAKIIHFTENRFEPFQHAHLPVCWSAHILRILDSQCVNAPKTRYRGYNMFPDEGLERLLRLVESLSE